MLASLVLALPVCPSFLPIAQADWPQFRGPGGLCVASDVELPAELTLESGVRWKVAVPAGHSSPCVVGGRIFLTGFEDGRDVVVAVERASGKELWRKAFEGTPHPEYAHPDAGPALPTAVSDGERVIAYFGNYGLVALGLDGAVQWELRLPHPGYVFGVGTSPVLFDGLLVLARDGGPEGALLVVDPSDGSELFRISRLGFGESHGTPFLWRNADRTELVVSGNGRLCAYDPGTGDRLWMMDGMTAFPCTTPTADEDTLYFAGWSTPNATGGSFWEEAFGRALEISAAEVADPALLFARLDANKDGKVMVDEVPECRAKDSFGALDADRNGAWELAEFVDVSAPGGGAGENIMVAVARGGEGTLTKKDARWSWDKGLPYVSSPLLHRGRIWLVKAGGLVTALDAATGAPVFERERLSDRSEYYMSPVGAGGHVLLGSSEGTLYVVDADAQELAVKSALELGEELFATPAVLDDTLYVRTKSTLWALGASAK
jgi:outer membrane protein assembly factor BamB